MSDLTDRLGGARSSLAFKAPCRVATTANVTLSGFQTIDGITPAAGDTNLRILVKDQTDATTNGIYDMKSGAWTRAKDFDGTGDALKGTRIYVANGSTHGNTEWIVSTADPITIGTSNIAFSEFAGGDALTTNPLSQFATTTSAQLAGVISDETGSGLLVFATSPTLTTPNIGAATGTSLSLSSGAGLQVGSSVPFSDAAGVLTLQNIDALDATTESTIKTALAVPLNLVADFGAVSGSSAVTAFNAAIAVMNANPGTTVVIPDGNYTIDSALNAITAAYSSFVGEGDNSRLLIAVNGNAFTWGQTSGSAIAGGGLRGCSIIYESAPGASACVFLLQNVTRMTFEDLNVENARTLAILGASASYPASSTWFDDITGYVYNSGSPTFDLRFGSGFYAASVQLYVGGVGFPADHQPATTLTTVAGTRYVQVTGSSGWDTVSLSDHIIERYDAGVYVVAATSATVNNIWIDNCIFDYAKTFGLCFYADTSSFLVGVHVVNSWCTAFDGVGIAFTGPGNNSYHVVGTSRIFMTASHGIELSATANNVTLSNVMVYANNRGKTTSYGILIPTGVSNVAVTGSIIGVSSSAVGLDYQATYGVSVGNVTNLDMTGNVASGSTGGGSFGTLTTSKVVANVGLTDSGAGYQASSSELTAVAALSTTGLISRTNAATYTPRTITGTANEITLSNGDGVSGNPTVSLPSSLTFTGKTITGGTYQGVPNIGVNVTPSYPMHVQGAGATSSTYSLVVQNSSAVQNFAMRDDGVAFMPATAGHTTGSAANLFIDSSTGELLRSTSSARYKTYIRPYNKGLDALMRLRPVLYKSAGEAAAADYAGFIAEEVHAAGLSEFVVYDKAGRPDALHYGNIVALVVAAIQDLVKNGSQR